MYCRLARHAPCLARPSLCVDFRSPSWERTQVRDFGIRLCSHCQEWISGREDDRDVRKRLSRYPARPVDDQAERELERARTVGQLLIPRDQDALEPVHPTVCPLHDPPPRLLAGLLGHLQFPTSCSDLRGVAELLQQFLDFGATMSLVPAHPLRALRARGWPLDRSVLYRVLRQLEIHLVSGRHSDGATAAPLESAANPCRSAGHRLPATP